MRTANNTVWVGDAILYVTLCVGFVVFVVFVVVVVVVTVRSREDVLSMPNRVSCGQCQSFCARSAVISGDKPNNLMMTTDWC
jgi:hypothetical protein